MSVREILPGIHMWRWMSPEKGYFFNGTLISDGKNRVLIDPAALDSENIERLAALGPVDAIYLSNRDHERMAYELRRKWDVPLAIHELDEPMLKERADFTFRDGHSLLCGIRTVHLQGQKSPGECAFYLPERKLLILGDALIGHPAGKLNLLPAEKYADVKRAQAGLRRLFLLHFEILLVGDGDPVLESAYEKLERCFEELC
jgi:glyoxylase-like metal-dependent hydrolase (beta-lactamase superfamily II)